MLSSHHPQNSYGGLPCPAAVNSCQPQAPCTVQVRRTGGHSSLLPAAAITVQRPTSSRKRQHFSHATSARRHCCRCKEGRDQSLPSRLAIVFPSDRPPRLVFLQCILAASGVTLRGVVSPRQHKIIFLLSIFLLLFNLSYQNFVLF